MSAWVILRIVYWIIVASVPLGLWQGGRLYDGFKQCMTSHIQDCYVLVYFGIDDPLILFFRSMFVYTALVLWPLCAWKLIGRSWMPQKWRRHIR